MATQKDTWGKRNMNGKNADIAVTVIEPIKGWELVDFKELRQYKDLFYFLIWRDIKVLYAQTILGFGWALLQPLIQIVIFTIIFGNVAKIATDGVPYFLFTTLAIVPWTYMSTAATQSSQSLVSGQAMLGKIYFPRLIFPIVPIFSRLVDFAISMLIVLVVMVYYGVDLSWNILYLPIFLLMMIALPAGVGMWLAALAIRFRDVKFGMQFGIRMLMYTAPIIYSASTIPDHYRIWYSLNPLVGVIEGFRASLLGAPIPWEYIYPGMASTLVILVSGALYFRRMERVFSDVI